MYAKIQTERANQQAAMDRIYDPILRLGESIQMFDSGGKTSDAPPTVIPGILPTAVKSSAQMDDAVLSGTSIGGKGLYQFQRVDYDKETGKGVAYYVKPAGVSESEQVEQEIMNGAVFGGKSKKSIEKQDEKTIVVNFERDDLRPVLFALLPPTEAAKAMDGFRQRGMVSEGNKITAKSVYKSADPYGMMEGEDALQGLIP